MTSNREMNLNARITQELNPGDFSFKVGKAIWKKIYINNSTKRECNIISNLLNPKMRKI